MNRNNRRLFLASLIAAPALVGCSTESIDKAIDEIDTDTLEKTAIALGGFAVLSCAIGTRTLPLPTPGLRILGVALVVTGVVTKLAIQYLDVELKKRYVEEALSKEEAARIESNLAVTFNLENGETEKVLLGPNEYVEQSQTG